MSQGENERVLKGIMGSELWGLGRWIGTNWRHGVIIVLLGREWVHVYYDMDLKIEVDLGDPDLSGKVRKEVGRYLK